jgi:acetyltransferase-like isoleucine patch superfamily enzyme
MERPINYKIENVYNELVSSEDVNKIRNSLSSFPQVGTVNWIKRCISFSKNFLKRIIQNKRPVIHRTAILDNRKLITLKEYSEIQNYVIIKTYQDPVIIGKYTQINPFCVIYGHSGVYIGDNVMIAPHCMIATGNHNYRQRELPMRFAGHFTRGPITIKDDVWIGANCTIGDGVTIGEGAVVSANSFVNRDVEPYSIVRGVPAIKIGSR